MRVVVDFDLCESNALCMAAAPEVFEVRDDDFLYVLDENPPEELRDKSWPPSEAAPRTPSQSRTDPARRTRSPGRRTGLGHD